MIEHAFVTKPHERVSLTATVLEAVGFLVALVAVTVPAVLRLVRRAVLGS